MGAKPSAKFYCGNNNLHNGKPLGTRNQCLRIGVGLGKNLPCDTGYGGAYAPIDTRKVWCGEGKKMPGKYDIEGSTSMCLQKGVGIGKNIRAKEGCQRSNLIKIIIFISVWVILTTSVCLGFYFGKPNFVLREDDSKIVDGGKLALYSIIFGLILGIVLWIISVRIKV